VIRSTHTCRRPAAILAILALAALTAACASRNRTVTISPDLIEDKQQRLVRAIDLASKASRTDDPEDAMALYWDAVTEYPQLAAAWNNLGELLMEHDRALEAADAFQAAMQLAPGDPRPVYNMGLLWDRKGFRIRARQYYLDAIERDAYFLNALRGSIRADALLNEASEDTLSHIERALLLEKNPDWELWLRGQKIRVENQLSTTKSFR
jgi:tetratricopeptide (TPR) repeat protein